MVRYMTSDLSNEVCTLYYGHILDSDGVLIVVRTKIALGICDILWYGGNQSTNRKVGGKVQSEDWLGRGIGCI